MAAVAHEEISAFAERAVQVERRDRPARALPFCAIERDQDRRAREALDDARRDDADHARMPTLGRDHESARGIEVEALHHLDRGGERSLVEVLAAAVEFLEVTRQTHRLLRIARGEQLDAADRFAEPAHSVQSRRQPESDASGGERLAVESRRADERAQTGVRRIRHHLEAIARDHAILAAQRRDVGDRRERREVDHLEHFVLVAALGRRNGQRELEREPRGGEIRVRIIGAGPLRIHQRRTRRRLTTRQVVIDDDEIDPRVAQRAGRLARVRAAIAADHQLRLGGDGRAHAGHGEVVAVLDAARDERRHPATERAERAHHDRGRGHAVHVVVAVEEDHLSGVQRARDPRDGIVHAGQARWRQQLIEPRAQVSPRVIRNGVSAAREQLTDRRRQMQFSRERGDRDARRSVLWRRKAPLRLG